MNITGIILAGGLGTRMGHTKKGFIEINGHTILDRLLAVYQPLFPKIIISARETDDLKLLGYPVAEDKFDARSSLTGIHAGLTAMRSSHGFFAACDAPFLQKGLVELLLNEVEQDLDVIIPLKEDGYREPLCAVYSKRCLEFIEPQLDREDYKIIHFFEHLKVKEVPVAQLKTGDPNFVSFFNVNRPEDLAEAKRLAIKQGL
jgi:molybdopterin-guanine dinucleotide biosynthesis protein A